MEKQCADAVQVSSADDLAAYCESVLRRYSVMHRENRWAVVEGARYLLDRQYPDGWQMESDVQQGDALRAVRKRGVRFDKRTTPASLRFARRVLKTDMLFVGR